MFIVIVKRSDHTMQTVEKQTVAPRAPVSPGRPVGGGIVVVVVDLTVSSGILTSGQSTILLTSAGGFPDDKQTRHL